MSELRRGAAIQRIFGVKVVASIKRMSEAEGGSSSSIRRRPRGLFSVLAKAGGKFMATNRE